MIPPLNHQRAPRTYHPSKDTSTQPSTTPRDLSSLQWYLHSTINEPQGLIIPAKIPPHNHQQPPGTYHPCKDTSTQPSTSPTDLSSLQRYLHTTINNPQGLIIPAKIPPHNHQQPPGTYHPSKDTSTQPSTSPRDLSSMQRYLHTTINYPQGLIIPAKIPPHNHQLAPGTYHPSKDTSTQPSTTPRDLSSLQRYLHTTINNPQGRIIPAKIPPHNHQLAPGTYHPCKDTSTQPSTSPRDLSSLQRYLHTTIN